MNLSYFQSIDYNNLDVNKVYMKKDNKIYLKSNSKYTPWELIIKGPIFQLDKYPINHKSHFNLNDNSIELKLPYDQSFVENNFYKFVSSLHDKVRPGIQQKYPNYQSSKQINYFKIKDMEIPNYKVYEVFKSSKNYQPIVKEHKDLTNLTDIFKSNYYVVPYIQVKSYLINNISYLSFYPVKFYIGEYLDTNIVNQVTSYKSKLRPEKPNCEFYNNDVVIQVTSEQFNKLF